MKVKFYFGEISILRNVLFWTLLVIALILAAFLTFPFFMNECQLNNTQAEIESCFDRNALASKIYATSLLGFIAFSITLFARQNRWAFLSIALVAFGPFTLMFST